MPDESQWVEMTRALMSRRLPNWTMADDDVDGLLQQTITDFKPPSTDDHGGVWNSTAWTGGLQAGNPTVLASVHRLHDTLREKAGDGPMRITRRDVFAASDSFDLFVTAMVWGFTESRYGWWRTAEMIRKAGVERVRALVDAARAATGPAAPWDVLTGPSRIKGLAAAFGTKVAYFAAFDRRAGTGPLIVDGRTRWALWAIDGALAKARPKSDYVDYVNWCRARIGKLGRADDVERALFEIGLHVRREFYGRGRRGSR